MDKPYGIAHGGSLRRYAQKFGGRRCASSAVGDLIDRETTAGLDQRETYRDYNTQIIRLRDETASVLRHSRERGKVVVGYGVSATVTTLLHHLQIGTMMDFLVEDNPLRHGTVSAGTNLPVIDPSHLYRERPDLVVILAWRFAQLIVDRHRPYLEQGQVQGGLPQNSVPGVMEVRVGRKMPTPSARKLSLIRRLAGNRILVSIDQLLNWGTAAR